MLRDIGKTYTHNMKNGPIAYLRPSPNPLNGGQYLLLLTRSEDEAKAVEKIRNSRALDERAGET